MTKAVAWNGEGTNTEQGAILENLCEHNGDLAGTRSQSRLIYVDGGERLGIPEERERGAIIVHFHKYSMGKSAVTTGKKHEWQPSGLKTHGRFITDAIIM